MNYKFKHLEKHHRVELSEKIYRTTKNYNPIGDLVELIDKIIDVYISSNMRTTEPETPKYTAEDMENIATWVFLHHHDLMYRKISNGFIEEWENERMAK